MDPDAVETVGRVPHGSCDDPEVLDFSANTNPELPDGVTAVYRSALDQSRSYPPEPPTEYRAAAAEYVDCTVESVVPTPGGLAGIRLATELAVQPGDSVVVPAPSFGEYEREVRLQGATPVFRDESEILHTDPDGHAMVVLCNPNNPTGRAYDEDALRALATRCRAAGTLLLVDEAFLDFTDRPSLAGTPGTVVARSLTKMFGLPGIRAGFVVATGTVGENLQRVRRPWNIGTPALEVGTFCLRQGRFVEETRKRVRTERERMGSRLSERFDVSPSEAPFLLFDVGERGVDSILESLREDGIALRDARTFRGLDSHVRVAVRRPDENDRLLEALADV